MLFSDILADLSFQDSVEFESFDNFFVKEGKDFVVLRNSVFFFEAREELDLKGKKFGNPMVPDEKL